MGAIYKKEMKAYFTTPVGYIFIAAMLLLTAVAFSFTTLQVQSWQTSQYFTLTLFVFIVLVPVLTMKSFSEERRTRTEQMLLTSPVSLTSMVMAKYFAAMTMMAGVIVLTGVYYLPLYEYADPETAILLGDMIALLLVGSAFVALGLFISSLTENQMVSCVITIVIILLFLVASFANSYINSSVIRTVLNWISVFSRFGNFTNGIFDFAATLYYLSITAVGIFLTVRVYEKRRWG